MLRQTPPGDGDHLSQIVLGDVPRWLLLLGRGSLILLFRLRASVMTMESSCVGSTGDHLRERTRSRPKVRRRFRPWLPAVLPWSIGGEVLNTTSFRSGSHSQ